MLLVFLGWFRSATELATGDVGHFVRDRYVVELLPAFGYEHTGVGTLTWEIVRVLELPFWWIGQLTSIEWLGQASFYSALAAWTMTGGTAFVRSFGVDRGWLAVAIGTLAVVNPVVLTTFPNPNTLLMIGATCWAGSWAFGGRSVGYLVAATLPSALLAVNPPSVVALALAVSALSAAAWTRDRRMPRRFAAAVPVLVAAHLWWIVPAAVSLLGGGAGELAAETDVDAWSWSHRNNSLGRVVTLVAHWGWNETIYFPFAPAMDHVLWGWTAWVLPLLAVAGAVVAPPPWRRPARLLAATGMVAVLLAKGLHAPFGALNAWLYGHVPGLWLFREPMSKFAPILLVVYLPLAATALHRLLDRTVRRGRHAVPARPLWVSVVAVVLVAAPLLYPWPILTGEAAPGDRGLLPPARSSVPGAWQQVAAHVNGRDGGKVLLLPLPAHYQATTDWGFHGVSAVPMWLLTRPLVAEAPGSYLLGDRSPGQMAATVQQALLGGADEIALSALRSLGVTDVLLRHDVVAGPSQQPTADPAGLAGALGEAGWADETLRTEVASVYRVADAAQHDGRVSTYASLVALPDDTLPWRAAAAAAIGAQVPVGTGVEGATVTLVGEDAVTRATEPVTALAVTHGPRPIRVTVEPGRLRVRPQRWLSAPSADREPSAVTPLAGEPLAMRVGDATVPLSGRQIDLGVPTAGVLGALVAVSARTLDVAAGMLGDCDRRDDRTLAEVGIAARREADAVTLSAREHAACYAIPVGPSDGSLVVVDFERQRGTLARACLLDRDTGACVDRASSTASSGRLVLEPTDPQRAHDLYLYADADEQPARIRWSRPRLATVEEVPLAVPTPRSGVTVQPRDEVFVAGTRSPVTVASPSPVGDCAQSDERSMADVGIRARPLDGGIELRAREHTACVTRDIEGVAVGVELAVAIEWARGEGAPPRACLWADGPDTCIATATGGELAEGERGLGELAAPVPYGTSHLQLYVYADGRGPATETATWYGDVHAQIGPGVSWLLIPAMAAGEAPAVAVGSSVPDRVSVSIAASTGRFVLVLHDGDADGWELSGIDPGRIVGRTVVDGYAPAWVLAPGPAVDITAVHVVSRRLQLVEVGLLVLTAAAAVVALRIRLHRVIRRARQR